MNENKLLEAYKSTCPHVQKIYVMPDIIKFSRHNQYLHLFYKEFIEGSSPAFPELQSFSFFNPAVILRKILGEKSIVHHHWYEFGDLRTFLNLAWKTFWIIIYRALGGKLIWSVHNRYPHQEKYRKFNHFLRKRWAKLANSIHVHCHEAIGIMSPLLAVPGEKFFVIPHPEYPAQITGRQPAIEDLNAAYSAVEIGSDSKVFLMFGHISAYKGIAETASIFKSLEGKNILVIAGAVKKGEEKYYEEIRQTAKGSPNIILVNRSIPEEDVPLFFNAADYVVFNHRDVLSSGGIMLALAYRKKIICANRGCIREVSGENIFKFNSQDELADILTQCKSE